MLIIQAIVGKTIINYKGTDGDDSLYGKSERFNYNSDEIFNAGAGNDYISADSGNDVLYGEDGDDKLYGGNGDDVLVGGTGEDYLEGGSGNDSYIYHLGDGVDTVNNNDSSNWKNDKIVFGEGIKWEDLRFKRNGDNLEITFAQNKDDKIILKDAYYSSYSDGRCWVGSLEFSDGTIKTYEDIKSENKFYNGTAENDSLTGKSARFNYDDNEVFKAGAGNDYISADLGNDVLYGEDGDDKLYGGSGDDVLVGGTGNDYLEGGNGSDIYIYNQGDGNDVIYDSSGNDLLKVNDNAEKITFEKQGNNLVVYSGDGSITIKSWYSNSDYQIENISAYDGYSIDNHNVSLLVDYMASINEQTNVSDAIDFSSNSQNYNVLQFWSNTNALNDV